MPDRLTTLRSLPAPQLGEQADERALMQLRERITAAAAGEPPVRRARIARLTRMPRRIALAATAAIALGSVTTALALTQLHGPARKYREIHYYRGDRQVRVVECPGLSGGPLGCRRPSSQLKRYRATTYDVWYFGGAPPGGG
jgi:hypothetical protein